MSRFRIWACALLVTTGTAANAAVTEPADQPVDTAKAMLERMDRNLDGKIAFEEYRNAMVRRFDARDRNGDGVLEGDEFPKEWLAGADVQGATGKVSWEQFVGELQLVFDRFDANKDGQLESAEITAFAGARKAEEESKS
jgi:Ca2+-binding EF-hand superfamily protein